MISDHEDGPLKLARNWHLSGQLGSNWLGANISIFGHKIGAPPELHLEVGREGGEDIFGSEREPLWGQVCVASERRLSSRRRLTTRSRFIAPAATGAG